MGEGIPNFGSLSADRGPGRPGFQSLSCFVLFFFFILPGAPSTSELFFVILRIVEVLECSISCSLISFGIQPQDVAAVQQLIG